MNLTISVKR